MKVNCINNTNQSFKGFKDYYNVHGFGMEHTPEQVEILQDIRSKAYGTDLVRSEKHLLKAFPTKKNSMEVYYYNIFKGNLYGRTLVGEYTKEKPFNMKDALKAKRKAFHKEWTLPLLAYVGMLLGVAAVSIGLSQCNKKSEQQTIQTEQDVNNAKQDSINLLVNERFNMIP